MGWSNTLDPSKVAKQGLSQRRIARATPEYLREELARFEQRYGMSSEEFLKRWSTGELDDRRDFFQWYHRCYLAIKQHVLLAPAGWDVLDERLPRPAR